MGRHRATATLSFQSRAAPAIIAGTKYCRTFDGGVAWAAAAPTTEAVATADTLVYPVHVAPLPWPPSELADAAVGLVRAVPELEDKVVPSVVLVAPDPVAVAVAVMLAGTVPGTVPTTVPDIPETVAVPAANATGAAQSHTLNNRVSSVLCGGDGSRRMCMS